MRVCAFEHCSSSTYQLQKWKNKDCNVHQGLKHKQCSCKPPFVLFPFPTVLAALETRKDWIKAINRKDPKTGKDWQPNLDSRVCSYHFVDEKPSIAHSSPSINLIKIDTIVGIESSQSVTKRKRAAPDESRKITPIKARRSQICKKIDEAGVILNTEGDTQHNCRPIITDNSTSIPTIGTNDENCTLPVYLTVYKCNCRKDCNCVGCLKKDIEIAYLKGKIKNAHSIISDIKNKIEQIYQE